MIDLAGAPATEPEIPALLRDALEQCELGDQPLRAVWQNQAGGITWAVGGDPQYFAKWNPVSSGESLADEAERLDWLAGRHPAPRVRRFVAAGEQEVLVTCALPGLPGIGEFWAQDPHAALRALGAGLRRLHEVPIADCPYDWGVSARLRAAGQDPHSFAAAPPIDRLVLCQGDPCAPNTLIDANGDFAGHVDLARLGVADRWADLAVMTMSLGWNFNDYDESFFWEAYGVAPDQERIAYYRRLWDAT